MTGRQFSIAGKGRAAVRNNISVLSSFLKRGTWGGANRASLSHFSRETMVVCNAATTCQLAVALFLSMREIGQQPASALWDDALVSQGQNSYLAIGSASKWHCCTKAFVATKCQQIFSPARQCWIEKPFAWRRCLNVSTNHSF